MPVQKITTAFTNVVADVIDDARANNITLAEVCARAGVGRTTLYRYARAAPEPVQAAERLRRALRRLKRERGLEADDD